ncbi:hypothetical protein TSUD_250570 [Trifolium subterraneum]|nr:hypothetical protein TSUD_250570 [Trifolium subterraneum]
MILRENYFTGGIPGFLAEFSNLRELQLGGSIPSEIGKLKMLQSLDISLNNLTGSIVALEDLVSLIEVNISYNLFNGSVPTVALTKQVTTMFLLALQCTERDLRKRPEMKEIIGLFKMDLFKRCDEEEYGDAVASDTLIQPYSPSDIYHNIPVVSIDHHLHGESSRAAAQRQREVTCNLETEPHNYSNFSFSQDVDQFQSRLSVEDDWSLIPKICINGLLVKLMENGKIMAQKVVVKAALNVPKVTYVWPSLTFIPSVVEVMNLVSWVRSIWLETGKIEEILDPYLTSSFPNSVSLTKQVTTIFLLALQCTETDPGKRPTMKDVIDLYKNDLCNWWCSEVDYGDPFVADTTLQPYSPCNLFSEVPVVSIDHHLHGEICRSRIYQKREVISNMEIETRDNSDFRFWKDADQFPLGVYGWDDWKLMSKPAVGIDGLVIKLMGNCETELKTVVTEVATLVNWARSLWMETGKIEKIVDSGLANSFPSSSALTKQVTTVFLLALQCTDKDLRNRPTMKDVLGLYNNDLFKWSCGKVEHGDAVADNTVPQPYIPYNLFPDDPVIGIDYHLH